MHAAVAATAWVIGKENVSSSEINISGLGCGRAVGDRIAPAIDDVLSPAAANFISYFRAIWFTGIERKQQAPW